MRRMLGIAVTCCLLLSLLAAPAAAATTTLVDCGAGADLQAAIDAASPGDTLLISGTCVGNFTAAGKVLNLGGQGRNPMIAGGPSSTDAVLETGTGTISRLTIGGGIGAGIYNNGGHLTLSDVTVRDNGDTGIVLDGPLTMIRSTVSGNGGNGIQAGQFIGVGADIRQSSVRDNGGAGIVNLGLSTLTDSTVRDNVGVGIANRSTLSGRGNLTVIHSTISRNTGGGISNEWQLSISDSKVMHNTTTGFGGGILNLLDCCGRFGVLTMSHSKVIGNTAGIDGGGIYNANSPSFVTLVSVKFKNNTPNDCVGC